MENFMKFTRCVVLNIVALFISTNAYSGSTENHDELVINTKSYQQVGGGNNDIRVPANGIIKTTINSGIEGLMEGFHDFPVRRAAYLITGSYYRHGLIHCRTKSSRASDVLYFRVTPKNGVSSSSDWIYYGNSIEDGYGLYWSNVGAGLDKYVHYVPQGEILVNYDKLDEAYYAKLKRHFGDESEEYTISFMYIVCAQAWKECDDYTSYFNVRSIESNPVSLYICNAGKIKANESYTPYIKEEEVYAVYPSTTQQSWKKFIEIESEESPSVWTTPRQQLTWNLTGDRNFSKKLVLGKSLKESVKDGISQSFSYSDLTSTGDLKEGDAFKVTRNNMVPYTDVSCTTEPINFKVVKALDFERDYEEKEVFICPTEDEVKFANSSNYSNESEWLHLKGLVLNVGDLKYKSVYGIKYVWEYKNSESGVWSELPIYAGTQGDYQYNCEKGFKTLYQTSPQDLVARINMFKAGESYDFRQVAILEGFQNIRIESDKYITVRSYNTISKDDFVVGDLGVHCADGETREVELSVALKDNGANYKFVEDSKFKYEWKFALANVEKSVIAEKVSEKYNLVSAVEKTYKAEITVTDGCGTKANLTGSISFEKQPYMDPKNIICSKSSMSYENDIAIASVPEGAISVLSISTEDEDYNVSNYQYSEDGVVYSEISRGVEVNLGTESTKTIYVKKVSKNGNFCESQPVQVVYVKVGEISNNRLNSEVVYVCAGEKNPTISATIPSGGYGDKSYTYKWIYSDDDVSYSPMLSGENLITSSNLPAGKWAQGINKTYYIKRVVTSESGNGTISNTSDYVILKPYSTPKVSVVPEKTFVCYSDKVELSVKQDEVTTAELQKSVLNGNSEKVSYNFGSKKDGEFFTFGKASNYVDNTLSIEIDRDTMVYATIEMCGTTVTSTAVKISSGEDLSPKVEEGGCRVRGGKAEVAIGNTVAGRSYSILQDGVEIGTTSAELSVPETGDVLYKVVVSDDNCSKEYGKQIDSKRIHDKFKPLQLSVSMMDEEVASVCAGATYTVSNLGTSSNKAATEYLWYVNGKSVADAKNVELNYVFPNVGTAYTVVRESREVQNGELCQWVRDTVLARTYPKVTVGDFALSKSGYVCYGEQVEWTLSNVDGGSMEKYSYELYSGDKLSQSGQMMKDDVSKGEISFKTAGINNVYAKVYDDVCLDRKLYSAVTKTLQPIQAADMGFTLTASPSMVTESNKSTSISLSAKADNGDVEADKFGYAFTVGSGKKIDGEIEGSPFLLVIDSTYFTNDRLVVSVDRTEANSGCTANAKVVITQSQGFEDVPSISSDASGESVCGGEKVTFEIAELPTFGTTKLTPKDVAYSWYKDGSLIASTETCTVTAVAGDTMSITCKISYKYDDVLKPAYVYAKEVRLVGKSGVKIGGIKEQESASSSINICVSEAERENLTLVADDIEIGDKDALEWQQSGNGTTWTRVPTTNIYNGGEPDGRTLTVVTEKYAGKDGVVYFRLQGTSECGTKTYSDNIVTLRIDTLPAIPVVALRSGNVINGTSSSLNFSPKSAYKGFIYRWGTSEDDLNSVETDGGAQAILAGEYKAGMNKIYVQKVAKSGGRCASAVAEYDFKLYEELTIGNLVPGTIDTTDKRCPNNGSLELYVVNIKGGSGSYDIAWEYKSEGGSWIAFDAQTKGLPFTAKFAGGGFLDSYQYQLILDKVSSTTSFRATISSTGGYSGESKTTNEFTVNYYEPLRDGGIDNGELLLCYGALLPQIDGKQPKGGDGEYKFQWMRTTTPELEKSWEDVTSATRQSYTNRDTMLATTYYKRIVTDGCGSVIESKPKRVEVQAPVEITAKDVNYNKAVSDGKSANMWGVKSSSTDESLYVWYDSRWTVLDTTEVSEVYSSKGLNAGDDQMCYTFYVKKIDALNGCMSYNTDTLLVTAYSNTSGVIFVAGTQEENENSFWVCPGNTDVKVLSYKNPEGAAYKWYYRVTTNAQSVEPTIGDWTALRQANGAFVTAENISLDTLDVSTLFKNTTGRAKYIELKRLATFTISGENAEMESNVIRINVVPTMNSVNMLRDVVGSLTTERAKYCKGEEAVSIDGTVDFASETKANWNNYTKIFGPWLYDKEYEPSGFSTWYEYKVVGGEYDTADVRKYNDDGYAGSFMPGDGIDHLMNVSYNVRRATYDGCTSAYTDVLSLLVTDAVGAIDKVQMYGYEEGGSKKFLRGFEIGDSLVVGYNSTDGAACMWALDSLFENPLEESKSYVGLKMTEGNAIKLMQDPHIYLRRMSNSCWSSTLAIPIALGSPSDGGIIADNQKVCRGAGFGVIKNVIPASGNWIAPSYNAMKWTYSWQYSKDSTDWVDIAGSDSIDLTEDLVNKYASLMSGNDSYFRRVAKNDSGRVRYSNSVRMSYYDELVPGELSMDSKKGLCIEDELPVITSTEAKGGMMEYNGVSYSWYVSLNGGEYVKLEQYKSNKLSMLFVDTVANADRSENNTVSVKCVYTDGCGTVESQPLDFTLYRENNAPAIYQDNDSCDANEITIKVMAEKVAKTYLFVAFSEDVPDSVVWSMETTQQTIKRVNDMVVGDYGVYSVDDQTGCISGFTYFNVDSLPRLKQEELVAPAVVCYGTDFTVVGGEAVGGNGEKTYQWQYSYDNLEWMDQANSVEADLNVVNPKASVYYRRIAKDMCSIDTTEAVYVKVREKVKVGPEDLVLHDYKCEGRSFNAELAEGLKNTENDYYRIWTPTETGWSAPASEMTTVEGFEGDSLEIKLSHYVIDSSGYECEGRIFIYAHNAVAIDHEKNVISCADLTPCNGRLVDVAGEKQSSDRGMSYKWYLSNDGKEWTEQLLMTGKDLRVEVKDTMFIKRLVYNGCEYDTSNVLTIIGTKVETYDYVSELGLAVISNMEDSSVVLNLERGKEFADGYYMEGDGEIPTISGNLTVLPYDVETYRDSLLQIVAYSDHCITTYKVTPLRGGVISFDGEGILCGGGKLPTIVVTDIEGGVGGYTYQWQYKNKYTSDYINIDGATQKEYTPSAVSVETNYRRLTFSGEYVSYSNVVSVNIRPLPKAKDIVVSLSDSVIAGYGLSLTQYSVEKLPAMEMSLRDSISDVDEVLWQKSYDGIVWEDIEKQEASASGMYELYLTDTTEVVYYRAVGTSTCGETSSKAFKVRTVYAPVILDEELVLTNNICLGDQYVSVTYKKNYSGTYSYTYRTINYEGSGVFEYSGGVVNDSWTEEDYLLQAQYGLDDTTKTKRGAMFTYPKHSFDVEVTRIVNATGASSTKLIHFNVNDLRASFSYVVDGVDYHQNGEPEQTVRLNQGSRVVFTPEVTGGSGSLLSYKWNLIEPLNTSYYGTYGGSVGRDGLTSEREEPVCYFYNGGIYRIKLTVSDGQCESVVKDSALYIDKSTVRSYPVSAHFDDDGDRNADDYFVFVNVNPTRISEYFDIKTNSIRTEYYELYDAKGIKVKDGMFNQNVRIETSGLSSGVYVLSTCGKVVKLVKD